MGGGFVISEEVAMISVHVSVREAAASVEWDGDTGWHPEVVTDMARRAVNAAVSAQHLVGEVGDE